MKIAVCAPHEVDAIWHLVQDGMQESYERAGEVAEYTAGEIWQLTRSGNAFLVLVWDDAGILSAGAWRFERKGGKPVLRCLALFGKKKQMRTWLKPVHEWINNLARNNGALWLVAGGRPGWLRVFDAAQWDSDYAIEVTR